LKLHPNQQNFDQNQQKLDQNFVDVDVIFGSVDLDIIFGCVDLGVKSTKTCLTMSKIQTKTCPNQHILVNLDANFSTSEKSSV